MNDLRKAAEQALECLDYHWDNPDSDIQDWPYVLEAKKALRQALAQSEYVTEVVAMHENGTYTTKQTLIQKREWVGLTDEEKQWFKGLGFVGIDAIETKLKDKNG